MFNYMHYGKGYSDLSLRIGFVVQDIFWPNLTIFGSQKPTEERALYEWMERCTVYDCEQYVCAVHNDDFLEYLGIFWDFWDISGYFWIFGDFLGFLEIKEICCY